MYTHTCNIFNDIASPAPSKPTIAVSKCSRSTNKVVLVLSSASCETEIVDGYQVRLSYIIVYIWEYNWEYNRSAWP